MHNNALVARSETLDKEIWSRGNICTAVAPDIVLQERNLSPIVSLLLQNEYPVGEVATVKKHGGIDSWGNR